MKGIIDELINNSDTSVKLRNRYVFKLIPMLNPDGVLYGNNRCSLIGVDLNRHYINPIFTLTPTIQSYKKLINHLSNECNLYLIADIHGHSRLKNIVSYGIDMETSFHMNKQKDVASFKKRSKLFDHYLSKDYNHIINRYQLFPYLLSNNLPNIFSFNNSSWNLGGKIKEGTVCE